MDDFFNYESFILKIAPVFPDSGQINLSQKFYFASWLQEISWINIDKIIKALNKWKVEK